MTSWMEKGTEQPSHRAPAAEGCVGLFDGEEGVSMIGASFSYFSDVPAEAGCQSCSFAPLLLGGCLV
jgi:hypothetical protein